MLSQSEYERDFPNFAKYAAIGRVPANNGYYQAPLNQGSVGMNTFGGTVYANPTSFMKMRNNHNMFLPYAAGLSKISSVLTPQIHREVMECTRQTHDPAGCNIAGVHKAMHLVYNPHQ